MAEGTEPGSVRDAGAHVDALPEELDVTGFVGPYQFPDNRRRAVPAVLYLVTAAACLALYATAGDAVLVNRGVAVVGVALAALGLYHLAAAPKLHVREVDALAAASAHVGFPVGHASAQLGWRGLLSRPTWRILLYSAEDPPHQRGLALIDGVDGRVVESWVEQNPEDWSEYR